MNNIARRMFFVVVLALGETAAAASPETLVGDTAIGPAIGVRDSSAVASDGTNFFAAWSDRRAFHYEIRGTRITPTGKTLDPVGIPIASANGRFVQTPNVVWDGAAYLVVWTEFSYSYDLSEIRAARIDRDGHIIAAPQTIAAGAYGGDGRYVASNGTLTLIAYFAQVGPKNPVHVVLLDRNLNVIHRHAITAANHYRAGLAVAATPSRFVVATSSRATTEANPSIEVIALNNESEVLADPVLIGGGDLPAIATDGTRFVVVSRLDLGPQFSLVSHAFDADLTNRSGPHTIQTGTSIARPSLLWRGDRYEMIAQRRPGLAANYQIASYDLDHDGALLTSRFRGNMRVANAGPKISAATNGSDLVVVWTSMELVTREDITARVYHGRTAAPASELLLSTSGNAHTNPQIVTSPHGSFVAWDELDGAYATRVDAHGNSLDGRGIALGGLHPKVQFDGTNYVVAHHNGVSVTVRYIHPSTGATVAEVLLPLLNVSSIDLAVSSDASFVAFDDGGLIRVARIPHATHVADPMLLTVSHENTSSGDPAISWSGTTLLVTWSEQVTPMADPPLTVTLHSAAARVTANLDLLDPTPLRLDTPLEDVFQSLGPTSVASNGEDWLVVWMQDNLILGRRVLRDGTVEGNEATIAGLGNGTACALTFDGKRYVLASKEELHTLVLTALAATGPMLTTQLPVRVATVDPSLTRASLARMANGDVAVAYTRISNLPQHGGIPRSYFRVMEFPQKGRVVRR